MRRRSRSSTSAPDDSSASALLDDKSKPDADRQRTPDTVRAQKNKERKVVDNAQPAPPEVATVAPPKPEEKKPEPVPPQPPPPPVEVPKQRMKMVDLDQPTDEPDNADAHFLAQKNHRALEETRALDTNLVREMKGSAQKPSSESQNHEHQVGDADRKIAELEDRKGKQDILPRGVPKSGEEGKSVDKPRTERGKLAMRDLVPRAVEQKQVLGKSREGVELSEEGVGALPLARVGDGGERQRAAQKGAARPNLQLDGASYDRIVGFDTAQKERAEAARGERSHVPGHWDKMQQRMAVMRSSLENFVGEVRPGNQTELGTRAHPFAAYIAEMHRQIHRLWAFGFLADLDARAGHTEYDDLTLWTQLEIVLKADGSVDKVTIVRTSGNAAYDVAAMDTVQASSPFPAPPPAIKSANGKVYLDWRFHRDDRQCGTFGVDPHILTTVGDNQNHDTSEVTQSGGVAPPRVLQRAPRAAPPRSVPVMQSPAPSSEEGGESSSSAVAAAAAPTTVPDAAKDAAEGWFGAYVRGDAGWLAGWSAAPFTADGQVVAKDGTAVKKVFATLIAEAAHDRHLEDFEVFTSAGIRAHRGGLPPGGETDGMFYAIGKIAGEELTLLLKKSDQGWRVCGLAR